MSWREELRETFADRVEFDVPLARKVAFRIGGPADAYLKVRSVLELSQVVGLCGRFDLPLTIVGTGSNVLISDEGIRGICLRLAGELADTHVGSSEDKNLASLEVGAGALNAPLVALALNLGLTGLEFLATIPGTFGGALIMNAGAHGSEIKEVVDYVDVLREGESLRLSREECGFGYRTSGFQKSDILLSSLIYLKAGDVEAARQELKHMRARRKESQPTQIPNAGSIFQNPPGDFAGRLIEAAGLKGAKRNDAEISPQHANFIVNHGNASAKDVCDLAQLAQDKVKDAFGTELQWEVKRLGVFS